MCILQIVLGNDLLVLVPITSGGSDRSSHSAAVFGDGLSRSLLP